MWRTGHGYMRSHVMQTSVLASSRERSSIFVHAPAAAAAYNGDEHIAGSAEHQWRCIID